MTATPEDFLHDLFQEAEEQTVLLRKILDALDVQNKLLTEIRQNTR